MEKNQHVETVSDLITLVLTAQAVKSVDHDKDTLKCSSND